MFCSPYGGRKRRWPESAKVFLQSRIWRNRSRCVSDGREGWSQVWLPIACPRAATSRTRSGYLDAAAPSMKNVPWALCLASTSSTRGVEAGSGPSSNVSAATCSVVAT